VVFDWPFLTLGCLVLLAALLLTSKAPTLATVFARFPFFYVPAPGEPTPPPLALAQITALPRRSAAAQQFQAGMIAASVILTALGSVLVVWLPERPSLLCWWLVGVVGIITVLRLRLFHAATPALWILASPLLTTAALAVSFAATGHAVATGWAAAGLAVLALLLIGLALLKPSGEMSIPRRGYLDWIQEGLLWTIYPTIVVLIGLLAFIRNRGWL
jgi:type VII secretion integral membrane protein EccD